MRAPAAAALVGVLLLVMCALDAALAAGCTNCAMRFPGPPTRLCRYPVSLPPTAVSFAFWSRSPSQSVTSVNAFVSYAVSTSDNEFLFWGPSSGSSSPSLWINQVSTSAGTSILNSAWQHIVVTWTSTSGAYTVYVNGTLTGSGSGLKTGYSIKPEGSLCFGADQDSVGGGFDTSQYLANGALDDIAMFSTVVNASRAMSLYQSGVSERDSDVMLLLRFNECTGAPVVDSVNSTAWAMNGFTTDAAGYESGPATYGSFGAIDATPTRLRLDASQAVSLTATSTLLARQLQLPYVLSGNHATGSVYLGATASTLAFQAQIGAITDTLPSQSSLALAERSGNVTTSVCVFLTYASRVSGVSTCCIALFSLPYGGVIASASPNRVPSNTSPSQRIVLLGTLAPTASAAWSNVTIDGSLATLVAQNSSVALVDWVPPRDTTSARNVSIQALSVSFGAMTTNVTVFPQAWITTVSPSSCLWLEDCTLTIAGFNLCNGSLVDITSLTVSHASASFSEQQNALVLSANSTVLRVRFNAARFNNSAYAATGTLALNVTLASTTYGSARLEFNMTFVYIPPPRVADVTPNPCDRDYCELTVIGGSLSLVRDLYVGDSFVDASTSCARADSTVNCTLLYQTRMGRVNVTVVDVYNRSSLLTEALVIDSPCPIISVYSPLSDTCSNCALRVPAAPTRLCRSNVVLSSSALSVAMWVRAPSTANNGAFVSFATTTNADEFLVYNPQSLSIVRRTDTKSTGLDVSSPFWQHLAFSWRASDGLVRVYRNGSLVYSDTGLLAGTSLATPGSLCFGTDQDTVGGGFEAQQYLYSAAMDDVAVYDRVLSASDAQQLFAVGVDETDGDARFVLRFNECNGSVLLDSLSGARFDMSCFQNESYGFEAGPKFYGTSSLVSDPARLRFDKTQSVQLVDPEAGSTMGELPLSVSGPFAAGTISSTSSLASGWILSVGPLVNVVPTQGALSLLNRGTNVSISGCARTGWSRSCCRSATLSYGGFVSSIAPLEVVSNALPYAEFSVFGTLAPADPSVDASAGLANVTVDGALATVSAQSTTSATVRFVPLRSESTTRSLAVLGTSLSFGALHTAILVQPRLWIESVSPSACIWLIECTLVVRGYNLVNESLGVADDLLDARIAHAGLGVSLPFAVDALNATHAFLRFNAARFNNTPYATTGVLSALSITLESRSFGAFSVQHTIDFVYIEPPSLDSAAPTVCALTSCDVSLIGEHLAYVRDFVIDTIAVDVATLCATPTADAVNCSLGSMPRLGYANVTVTDVFNRTSFLEDAFFFTSRCPFEGFYASADTGDCVECPEGGYCPGGERIWPLRGWWTVNEFTLFIGACFPSTRCLGGRRSPCSTGSFGLYCASCGEGYYQSGATCLECSSSSQIGSFVFVQLISLVLLIISATFSPAEFLGALDFAMFCMQVVWGSSATAGPYLPSPVSDILSRMSLFSGDVSFVQPECLSPDSLTGFNLVFLMTVVMLVGLYVPFMIVCAIGVYLRMKVRAMRARRLAIGLRDSTRFRVTVHDFRFEYSQRLMLGAFLFISFGYYSISQLALSSLFCVFDGATSEQRLVADRNIVCYRGYHELFYYVGWVLSAAIVVLAPVLGIVLTSVHYWRLHRVAKRRLAAQPHIKPGTRLAQSEIDAVRIYSQPARRVVAFNFWCNDFKPQYFWFGFFNMVLDLYFAVLAAFVTSANATFISSMAVLLATTVLFVALRPYRGALMTACYAVLMALSLISTVLGDIGDEYDAESPVLYGMAWTIAVLLLALLAMLVVELFLTAFHDRLSHRMRAGRQHVDPRMQDLLLADAWRPPPRDTSTEASDDDDDTATGDGKRRAHDAPLTATDAWRLAVGASDGALLRKDEGSRVWMRLQRVMSGVVPRDGGDDGDDDGDDHNDGASASTPAASATRGGTTARGSDAALLFGRVPYDGDGNGVRGDDDADDSDSDDGDSSSVTSFAPDDSAFALRSRPSTARSRSSLAQTRPMSAVSLAPNHEATPPLPRVRTEALESPVALVRTLSRRDAASPPQSPALSAAPLRLPPLARQRSDAHPLPSLRTRARLVPPDASSPSPSPLPSSSSSSSTGVQRRPLSAIRNAASSAAPEPDAM